ncbi:MULTISPECIES: RagB/SusD family nutrient uptake outer membrane protein [Olivibacter]|uniref:RagB/SusD family nutrient uptake outer membrane protein n=1 Tax=Olivibacter jilunii TaxID=985016 RepID=A0ABW6B2D6_9SPHI|nr:RagB/SusD family nutrient uptake outer membrane protein [Olivibacter sp. 47]MCL4638076.1 RagB/SusD family nutrient uptake outer membrane protein [Olivibacter sp. UJ_SKK_5.1]MDM8173005.1 RagB/SusD family nutrient uptake outer membrane protein [Olivibacter sp. 47]MDX3915566.1 RagB/SusD family nutrient uptake outer membrane protein [Pseudosphingobacterium sp.]
MRTFYKNIICFSWLAAGLALTGCNKMLDLKPTNEISDVDYWKTADQFELAANEFYTYLRTFNQIGTVDAPHAEIRGDLIAANDRNPYSNGTNTNTTSDNNYSDAFKRIRAINYFLDKASTYANTDEIAVYIAEAKFFRAYVYFDLLQMYGQVQLFDKPLAVDSPALQGTQNSREEVVDFIIHDLDEAILLLPFEKEIGVNGKGRVSKGAAQAFLGRVALYEGTWQKFRNGDPVRYNALLDKAIQNANAVIESGQYQLFAPQALGDSAQKYLFILENQQANPANLNKSANQEYILSNRYDSELRQIRYNVTHSYLGMQITKKFADMFLMANGLPINQAGAGFAGYSTARSEYTNRDNRMRYTMMIDGNYYWDNEAPSSRVNWLSDAVDQANSRGRHNGAMGTGYANQKWAAERRVDDNAEGYDYPVIRYAEVLLNYAEAVYERNEAISDADLNKSLNLVRQRVNKSMPKLSNGFVGNYGLDMRTEIRRERTVELFMEGFRVDDLKRWKTAEIEMPQPLQGITWSGTEWETKYPAIGNRIQNGVFTLETARQWNDRNYLLPIPNQEIQLNPNLKQNPGW